LRTSPIFAAAALCAWTLPAVADQPGGRVVDWPGSTAEILTHGLDGPVGRIDADGQVTVDLPTPPDTEQTVAETLGRCLGDAPVIENGEAQFTPLIPFTELRGRDVGMIAADSRESAMNALTYGQSPLVRGATLRWVHLDRAARLEGECTQPTWTTGGTIDTRVETRLEFSPGWNLLRTTTVDFLELEDGSRYETHTVYEVVQGMPEGFDWYLKATGE
jgi:hypothetical protein